MTIYERELLLVKDLRKLLKDIDYQMDESQKALDSTMSEKMDLQNKINKALEYIKTYIVDFNICLDAQDYDRIEVEVHYFKSLIEILKEED